MNLTSLAIKLFGPKAIRALLAWLASLLAAKEIAVDFGNITAFIVTLSAGLIIWLWSVIAKTSPDHDMQDRIKTFIGSASGLVLPMIFGWLNAHGISITGHETVESALAIGLTVAASIATRPDKTTKTDSSKLKLPLVLLFGLACLSSACTTVRNARLVQLNNAALRLCMLGLLALVLLPSCVYADSKGADQWRIASLGTNAQEMTVTAQGFNVKGMDQGTPAEQVIGKVASLQLQKKVIDAAGSVINETVDTLAK